MNRNNVEGYNPQIVGCTLKIKYPSRNIVPLSVDQIIAQYKNTKINFLQLEYFQFHKIKDVKKIVNELPQIVGVNFNSISFDRMDDENNKLFLITHLVEIIEINRLEEFSIDTLMCFDDDCLLLSNAIRNCLSLKKVHIGFNFWDRSGEKLKFVDKFNQLFFHSASNLIELNFKNSMMSEKGLASILNQLEKNKSVKHANFTNCGFNDKACVHLAKTLKSNNHLRDLLLDNNKIRDEGIIVLSSFLKENNTLRNFSIRDNYMRDSFIIFIGNLVKQQNSAMEILRIANNDFGSLSLKALSMSLNSIPKLTDLDLEGIKFNESSMSKFLLVVANNKTIRNLSLKNTFINPFIESKVSRMLLINKRLTMFGIGGSKYEIDRERWENKSAYYGKSKILDSFTYNTKLEYLDIGYIKTTSKFIKKALKKSYVYEIGKDKGRTICLNKCKVYTHDDKLLYNKFKRTKNSGFVEIPGFNVLERNNRFW